MSIYLFNCFFYLQKTQNDMYLHVNIVNIYFIIQMDGFKDPFDQNEGEQIITIAQPAVSSIKKNQQVVFNQKLQKQVKKQSKPQYANVQISDRQQSSIQPSLQAQQSILINNKSSYSSTGNITYQDPPLLQDIGVDPQLVADKITSIIKFQKPLRRYVEQTDLFGPLVIAFLLGLLLLLSGKMHFGDIYAMFVVGNLLVFVLFNLMSQSQIIPLYTIMSVLGYCLLPMLILGLISILASLKNQLGIILSLGLAVWCAYSAMNYVQILLKSQTNDRSALILYPLYLYYVSFAMITIF